MRISILYMKKLRHREVTYLAQSHTAREWQSWDSSPGSQPLHSTTSHVIKYLKFILKAMGSQIKVLGRAGSEEDHVLTWLPCGEWTRERQNEGRFEEIRVVRWTVEEMVLRKLCLCYLLHSQVQPKIWAGGLLNNSVFSERAHCTWSPVFAWVFLLCAHEEQILSTQESQRQHIFSSWSVHSFLWKLLCPYIMLLKTRSWVYKFNLHKNELTLV